jgi:hypothetical protein
MTPQLYNLQEDPREEKNLIGDRREVAARLADLLSTYRARTHSRRQ